MTAVVRWSMPQLCPTRSHHCLPRAPTSFSRGAGLPPADPGAPSLQAVPALSPTANSRPAAPPCRMGSRWPPSRSGDGRVNGPGLPRWPTAWPPAAVRQHINPGGRCAHSPTTSDAYCPFHNNGTNYSSQCSVSVPLSEGGGSQLTRCRPRASLDWIPGSATPQRWKHDGVHSRADALSPVLIQAVRDTPEAGEQ
jgi:hypothetical protein